MANSPEKMFRKLSGDDVKVMRSSVPLYLVTAGINAYLQYYNQAFLLEHQVTRWMLEIIGCIMKVLGVFRPETSLINPLSWRLTDDYGIKKPAEPGKPKELKKKE
ncbi:hypothetical protein E3Q19_01289 [Wallemia mellicola]|nr:hypothetical protein E3Q19_01289 [Wallemia mellicola]TIC56649.1 hypothetical protein E3Q04_00931 [Wallemia mellicola]TIC75761.1 hypothetical protein E3Q00_00555 [Wallemia mellicola]